LVLLLLSQRFAISISIYPISLGLVPGALGSRPVGSGPVLWCKIRQRLTPLPWGETPQTPLRAAEKKGQVPKKFFGEWLVHLPPPKKEEEEEEVSSSLPCPPHENKMGGRGRCQGRSRRLRRRSPPKGGRPLTAPLCARPTF